MQALGRLLVHLLRKLVFQITHRLLVDFGHYMRGWRIKLEGQISMFGPKFKK
jgi:hypothetical protein